MVLYLTRRNSRRGWRSVGGVMCGRVDVVKALKAVK